MTKYSVQKGNHKLVDEYRGDRVYGQIYIILKDDKPAYEVTTSTIADWCNCPGAIHHGKCKHLEMVYDYIGARHGI